MLNNMTTMERGYALCRIHFLYRWFTMLSMLRIINVPTLRRHIANMVEELDTLMYGEWK